MAEDASPIDSPRTDTLPAAPVAADTRDFARVVDYIETVCRDHVKTATLEAARLAPYLTALSRQLFADLLEKEAARLAENGTRFFGPPAMPEVMKPQNLSRLFTAVARDSQNTILSEMVVAPQSFLKEAALKNLNVKKFFSDHSYRALHYGLGFVQVPSHQGRGSVSVSIFTLHAGVLKKIPEQAAQLLLTALQKIVTAGNHDMQHHYTNKVLNSNISSTAKNTPLDPQRGLQMWNVRYFGSGFSDKFPDSYESWLMLNHRRVVERMEDVHHRDLYGAVETYFDTLANIKAVLEPAEVDYLSMMACFAMHRYLRLDHPLMLYAVERTQQIDRQPGNAFEEGQRYAGWADNGNKELAGIVESYPELFGESSDVPDYQRRRLLQIGALHGWSTLLLAPVVEQTEDILRKAHKQVAAANLDMVEASASDSRFIPQDGEHSFTASNGRKVTYVGKDGVLDAQGRPALVIEYAEGNKTQEWYSNGELKKRLEKTGGDLSEKHYANGELHREDGAAVIRIYANGSREEDWYKDGVRHREDGPAYLGTKADGLKMEMWFLSGQPHRKAGPARITVNADGSSQEQWWCEGKRHREDGPAYIETKPDGSREENWYRDGKEFIPSKEQLEAWQARSASAAPALLSSAVAPSLKP